MKKITIELSDSEYWKALSLKGDKTHREAYLDGLGIEYEKRKLGRPILSEIRERLYKESEFNSSTSSIKEVEK